MYRASSTSRARSEQVSRAGSVRADGALYLVGGNGTNDQVNVTPTGASKTGGTGIKVNANLNGHDLGSVRYSQAFATLYVVGFNGNDHVQMDPNLTIAAVVSEGDGNDDIHLLNGSNTVTVGNGNNTVAVTGSGTDVIQAGNDANDISLGNGTATVTVGDGNNLLVGGLGLDSLKAGNSRNILIDKAGNGKVGAFLNNFHGLRRVEAGRRSRPTP
jgi:hypothetical protein